jgi:hypothetical protein
MVRKAAVPVEGAGRKAAVPVEGAGRKAAVPVEGAGRKRASGGDQRQELTDAVAARASLDSLAEFDRLAASQAIAPLIARLLFDFEKQGGGRRHAETTRSTPSTTR